MTTYPTGTPQQNQLDAGMAQRIAAAQSTLNSGQTVTPDVASATSSDIAAANAASQSMQTPGGRQPYLDNTNLASTQGNYDALAKQLAQYDQMVMQPQFAGTNPGAPSELNGLSGYVNPNLSYNSADARTPEQTLYNANPTYGLTTQADQGNSIVALLGTLNKLLTNESARGTAKYTSDLSRITSALPQLNDILKQNTELTIKKAELANAKNSVGRDVLNEKAAIAKRIASSGKISSVDGKLSPTDYKSFKTIAMNEFGWSPQDFDSEFGSFVNQTHSQDYGVALSAAQLKSTSLGTDDQDFIDVAHGLDSYLTRRKGTGLIDRINPTSTKGIAIETEKQTLSRILAKLVEKNRISDSDAKFYINELPQSWMDDEQAQAKIDGVKNGIASKLGVVNDLNSGGQWK